jgi:hypothetical protein
LGSSFGDSKVALVVSLAGVDDDDGEVDDLDCSANLDAALTAAAPVNIYLCALCSNSKQVNTRKVLKLELCPKDTDAPTDNIYMVYSEKINKGP